MSDPATAPTPSDPAWPPVLHQVVERFVTCEYASLTRDGRPVTWAVTPYPGEDGRTIDVSTGLAYPAKAERARRDPRVSLLFSDPTASGLGPDAPVVLVEGLATVRDGDLQAAADRYAALSMAKVPHAWRTVPRPMIRAQRWYFARIWILVTPVRVRWWPGGNLEREPERWEGRGGADALASDPPPPGGQPAAWRDAPRGWRSRAEAAIAFCPRPVLTVVGEEGWPVSIRLADAEPAGDGVRGTVPAGMPAPVRGPACLTFHWHGDPFVAQRNATFVGTVVREGARSARFQIERALADFSLPGSRIRRSLAFLSAGRRLAPRLAREAARRGQPVPRVNLPPRRPA